MSVQIFSIEETQKIGNTISKDPRVQEYVETTKEFQNYSANSFGEVKPEDFIARAVWYAYIANTTAYNVQYQENEKIDFDFVTNADLDFLHEGISSLGSLIYNCYTNDGNCFLQDKWMDVLGAIYKEFENEIPEPEMPSYVY